MAGVGGMEKVLEVGQGRGEVFVVVEGIVVAAVGAVAEEGWEGVVVAAVGGAGGVDEEGGVLEGGDGARDVHPRGCACAERPACSVVVRWWGVLVVAVGVAD